jgi:hypothetical protein
MTKQEPRETLEVAMLPLHDGRRIVLPLQLLAEVQQTHAENAQDGFSWRGMELEVGSLDALCGLPEPSRSEFTNIGIFKADKDSDSPFRALGFCGNANHKRIDAGQLEEAEASEDGCFIGATRLGEETYLIADIPALLSAGA